jgi:hypothetical protein
MKPTQSADSRIPDSSLAAAPDLVRQVMSGASFKDVSSFAKVIARHQANPDVRRLLESVGALKMPSRDLLDQPEPLVQKELVQTLTTIAEQPGQLEKLAIAFAEQVYLGGGLHIAGLKPEVEELLRKSCRQLVEACTLTQKDCAPNGMHKSRLLRLLDKELVEFVTGAGAVTAQGYIALNEQHKRIFAAKRLEDERVLASVDPSLKDILSKQGIVLEKTAKSVGDRLSQDINRLIEAGIVDRVNVESVGPVLCYAPGSVSPVEFDLIVTPKLREKIADALWDEFQTRYSGKYRPIGIHANREGGIPTLSDRNRVSQVAEKLGMPVSMVVLALKVLEQRHLIETKHPNNGFELSEIAKKVGLGIRAVRYAERARESTNGAPIPSMEEFLELSKAVRDGWKLPEYSIETKDGGAPWIHLLDELLFPNARIDSSVVRSISDLMKARPGLVIASNMMQGDPAVFPRDQRTTVHASSAPGSGLESYESQLQFVKKLLASLGQPSVLLHGKRELETANLKADVQRVRDQQAGKGAERPAEATVGKALGRLNDIQLNAGRKYAARLQAANLLFMANVVMPLEFKIGREVMSSEQVHHRVGLRLNEVEILRDFVSAIEEDTAHGGNSHITSVRALYRDFLELPEVGSSYLGAVEQVLYPKLDPLKPGAPISRGGVRLQIKTPQGTSGLSVVALPEFKLGVGELQNPGKLISMLKSRAVAGRDVADVVVCGGVGSPFFSLLSTGQAIVTPGSLQASNFDDLYSYTESVDGHKRRRVGMGEERHAGHISFRGGVNGGKKTGAYCLQMTSAKIEEVLAANRGAKKADREIEIYQTNDLQLGSPTAAPAPFVRGLMWAIKRGVKDVVLDGDLIQGQNYGRFYAEAQMTGIIGIEDQQAFLSELFQPILDYIVRRKKEDPSFELPKFRIIVGNHEMNSQAGKGAQGNWYMQPLYNQIYYSYRSAFGDEAAANKVIYPRKYVSHDGTDVDYPIDILDYTEETGFRLGAQHYSGAGAKGSGSIPPIVQARAWNRSKENENREVHGWLWAHFHTQSIMMADGVFHAIFGANATGSGFEHHLGYPLTVPASGLIKLSSTKPPELQIVTAPFLEEQEAALCEIPEYSALSAKHGSLQGWVETCRRKHQRRDTGNAVNMQQQKERPARHTYVEPVRKIR